MSSVMRFDEWQDSDGNPVFNGAGGVSPGGLVAVKSAIRDTPEVFSSVAGRGNVAVTDLSITHEVADPDNRLIISAFFGVAGSTQQAGDVGIAVHDGTALINIATSTPGNQIPTTAGGPVSAGSNTVVTTMPSVTFVHTPGAGSKTYTVRAINLDGGAKDLFINRTQLDGNGRPRGVSSLTIQEVTV